MLIAIIGLIGSGKSEYARGLQDEGFVTANADDLNRELLTDEGYLAQLRGVAPSCFVGQILDKSALKQLIFDDPALRTAVEDIAHPLIMKKIRALASRHPDCDVFVEITAPTPKILAQFDYVIMLDAPYEVRLARTIKRDNISPELFKKINMAQPSDRTLKSLANEILNNG